MLATQTAHVDEISGPDEHQVGVVVGDAHGPGVLGVGVAQLVGQVLELVRANLPLTDVAPLYNSGNIREPFSENQLKHQKTN